ncbi:MAG: FKBP-type peptidyl-prolyl cis-trans isomerase [Candidatus Pacebacteria bacterium]|nr:FKBP-type peptidyl-prolyl cis-trans isomerase [Candidatus Paceibacterota bacterium]
MFSKFEMFGAGMSVFFMALALYLVQVQSTLFKPLEVGLPAQAISAQNSGVVVVGQSDDVEQARADAYLQAMNDNGSIERMVIDDVKFGTGEAVENGDTVAVHYVGTLQSGTEFDNSYKRGKPFEFTVGGGQVIKGWDQGLVGMKVGGQRVLVIPPALAYGERGIGSIPANATLVFSIELVEIK